MHIVERRAGLGVLTDSWPTPSDARKRNSPIAGLRETRHMESYLPTWAQSSIRAPDRLDCPTWACNLRYQVAVAAGVSGQVIESVD